MRKEVRIWNTRFNDPHQQMRRYSAAIAIVKEAIKKNLTIHEAYAFALTSEPLLDKQEEENGYSIQKRSEEHTSELQSLMRISYAVFCLKKQKKKTKTRNYNHNSKTEHKR